MDTPTTTLDPTAQQRRDEPAGPVFGLNVGEQIADKLTTVRQQRRWLHAHCNVGRTEQKIRLGAGVGLLAAAAFAPVSRGWKIGFALLGTAELITGATRYCPVSQAFGINTCRSDK